MKKDNNRINRLIKIIEDDLVFRTEYDWYEPLLEAWTDEDVCAFVRENISKSQFEKILKTKVNTDKMIKTIVNDLYAAINNEHKDILNRQKSEIQYKKVALEKALLADGLSKTQKAKLKKFYGVNI